MVKIEAENTFLVIIPKRKAIPKGTLLAIIKQAGLSKDDFISLLK